MNTTENNKKLAEFMEANKGIKTLFYLPQFGHYQNSYGQIDYVEVFREDELKFHNDWNWLMEVVEKIESLGKHGFTIYRKSTNINGLPIEIANNRANSKIEATYNACIEFIKWYSKEQIIGGKE